MGETPAERRLAANEVVFRQANEWAQEAVEQLNMDSASTKRKFHFYCECSNPNCNDRIELMGHEYKELHQDHRQFVIKPGHEVQGIENVTKRTPSYYLVEKKRPPPEQVPEFVPPPNA